MSSTLLASGLPADELTWSGPGQVTFICATNITDQPAVFSVHETQSSQAVSDATAIVKEQDAPPNTAVFLEFPGDGIDFTQSSTGRVRVLRLTPGSPSTITFHVYGVRG